MAHSQTWGVQSPRKERRPFSAWQKVSWVNSSAVSASPHRAKR